MSLRNAAIHGVKWSAVERWGRQIIAFILFAVLARLLGVEAIGLIAIAGIYIAMVQLLVTQGMGMAIIQRKELEQGHLDTAFWLSVASGGVVVAATLALADPIAWLFEEPDVAPILRWLSLSLLLSGLSRVHDALLVRKLQFKQLALRTIAAKLIGGAVGITMALTGWGVWALVGQQLTDAALSTILLWIMSDYRPSFRASWRHFRDLFSYSAFVMVNASAYFAYQRADQVIIGAAIGAGPLGLYTLAKRITTLLGQTLRQPLDLVTLPLYAKMQDDRGRMSRAIFQSQEMILLVCAPALVGLAVIAEPLVATVFGQEWLPAVFAIRALAIMELLGIMTAFVYPVLMGTGHPGWVTWLMAPQVLGVILAAAIGKAWGLNGVAVAMVASGLINAVIAGVVIRRIVPLSLRRLTMLHAAPFASAGLMGAGVWAVTTALGQFPDPVRLTAGIVTGAALYPAAAYLMSPRAARELLTVLRTAIIRKRVNNNGTRLVSPN